MKSNLLDTEKENELIVKAYAKLLRRSKSVISGDDSKIIKKAFTSKILPYKTPKDKIGIPEKPINPKENTLRH